MESGQTVERKRFNRFVENIGMDEVVDSPRTQRGLIYTVDSFENGIAFGQHKSDYPGDWRDSFALRVDESHEVLKLRSRYALHPKNPLHELERHLMRLSSQGVLGTSVVHLGVATDPFHPFHGKFDGSMKFLELFKRYTPGMLVIQTRSPLLVIALPVLQKLGNRAAVTIGVETDSADMAQRYTPELPRADERLKAAKALRRFGVDVTVQVSPVLPYGDWKSDAPRFAEKLLDTGAKIHLLPLITGNDKLDKRTRASRLAKRLADDRQFHFLRPDAAEHVKNAIEKIRPEALIAPKWQSLETRQQEIFAA